MPGFHYFPGGATSRTRTGDLLITIQPLYQLSYGGVWRPGRWWARHHPGLPVCSGPSKKERRGDPRNAERGWWDRLDSNQRHSELNA